MVRNILQDHEKLWIQLGRFCPHNVFIGMKVNYNFIIYVDNLIISILFVRCYSDIFQKYKNSYFHVKNKEIKITII
jgi:hypothetical protein